jgi:hypothetical protein
MIVEEGKNIIKPLGRKMCFESKIYTGKTKHHQNCHPTCIRTQTRWPNLCPERDAILQYDMYLPGNWGALKSTATSSSFSTGTPSSGTWDIQTKYQIGYSEDQQVKQT